MDKVERPKGTREDRVKLAAERLRELEDSGVEPSEILAGPAGAAFLFDECGGDPDLAQAAFTLVHSSKGQRERQ